MLSTIHNDLHTLHRGRMEMFRGQLVPCVEVPERVDHVLAELRQRGWGAAMQPPAFLIPRQRPLHRTRVPA